MLKHTLTPRMKASHIAIETMKDHLDAVYDVTVAYEGTLNASGHRSPAPSMPGKQAHGGGGGGVSACTCNELEGNVT